MTKKLTTEEWVERARTKHGDRYDYSGVDYQGNKKVVSIGCYLHGDSWQYPPSHIRGEGCLPCANTRKGQEHTKTTGYFIRKAREVHGDKYDYSMTEYTGTDNPLTFMCPIHGVTSQRPRDHLSTYGCSRCGSEAAGDRLRYDSSIFLKLATSTHGDLYDYTLVDYKASNIKVDIICHTHGIFSQTPASHLQGRGCVRCGNIQCGTMLADTLEDFLRKANEAHGDKYDYSLVDYVDSKTKVSLICNIHGEFRQAPTSHSTGSGCKGCQYEGLQGVLNSTLIERDPEKFRSQHCTVYLMKLPDLGTDVYKVGVSKDPRKRSKDIAVTVGEVQVTAYLSCNTYTAFYLEQTIHEAFALTRHRVSVRFAGHTELFTLTAKQVAAIRDTFIDYEGDTLDEGYRREIKERLCQ